MKYNEAHQIMQEGISESRYYLEMAKNEPVGSSRYEEMKRAREYWEEHWREYSLKYPLTPMQEINQWLERYCMTTIHKEYVKKQEIGKIESFLFKLASKLEFWLRKYCKKRKSQCPLVGQTSEQKFRESQNRVRNGI